MLRITYNSLSHLENRKKYKSIMKNIKCVYIFLIKFVWKLIMASKTSTYRFFYLIKDTKQSFVKVFHKDEVRWIRLHDDNMPVYLWSCWKRFNGGKTQPCRIFRCSKLTNMNIFSKSRDKILKHKFSHMSCLMNLVMS